MRTPLRTHHGRVTLVLYTQPVACGGACLYCIRYPGFTKSTTPNEDTILARDSDWNPATQIDARLHRYDLGHTKGLKVSLAVKGDSFGRQDWLYLRDYFAKAYGYLNGQAESDLRAAKEGQRHGRHRCVQVQVETRPDLIDNEMCELFKELGVTTVEMGVQSLDNDVLAMNRRGHDVGTVRQATRLLKAWGFEVGYHMMIGLPGASRDQDFSGLSTKLWETGLCPDAIKLYPCVLLTDVSRQPGLADLFDKGTWNGYTDSEYLEFLAELLPHIPRYVHINRVQRLFPPNAVLSGPSKLIDRHLFDSSSMCLWQRSVGQTGEDLESDFSDYRIVGSPQDGGICFEALSEKGSVLAYGRLELRSRLDAVVRDLHILGEMVPVGSPASGGIQHTGVGKRMLLAMETAALARNCEHIRASPPFGVRAYFEARGYAASEDVWMVKRLEEAVDTKRPTAPSPTTKSLLAE